MREHGIRARHKRRYRVTVDSKHKLPTAPNLLNREFTPDAPNQVFSSDMTYIWTDEGWLKLTVVLDLFNREVVGWSIKPQMTADLVTDALTFDCFDGDLSREHCAIRIEGANMRVEPISTS